MAEIHVQQLRDIVIEWYSKDLVQNGDVHSYASGFADGMKFTIQRLTQMGFKIPDAELFHDDPA